MKLRCAIPLCGALSPASSKSKDTSSSAHRAVVVARLRAAEGFTVTDYAVVVFSLDHCLGHHLHEADDWWHRQGP